MEKGEPNLHDESSDLGIGKAKLLMEGKDLLILAIGPIVSEAIKAVKEDTSNNKSVAIATMSSINPLDEEFLKRMIRRNFCKWITIEEHGLVGGLEVQYRMVSDNNLLNKINLKTWSRE